ncbi:MAG: hypothetical protein HY554_18910 [Elusimicrobia bacterium]|nr:hypothetical protein [Elusimicrobiota bacterium]
MTSPLALLFALASAVVAAGGAPPGSPAAMAPEPPPAANRPEKPLPATPPGKDGIVGAAREGVALTQLESTALAGAQAGANRTFDGAKDKAAAPPPHARVDSGVVFGTTPNASRARTAPVTAKLKAKTPKQPFWDDETIGFATMGMMAGGLLGIGLMGVLGAVGGPLLGAVLGAVLLVGLFKWKGYEDPNKKK